jgi:outer membrane protein TolC
VDIPGVARDVLRILLGRLQLTTRFRMDSTNRRWRRRGRRRCCESLVVWALGALGVAGCSAYWPLSEELQEAIRAEATPLEPAVDDDSAVEEIGERTAEGRVEGPALFDLPERPGLEDYQRVALARNPRIQAAIRDVEALGFEVPQVTSLDDPVLHIIPPTGDMIQTAGGMMDGVVGISQKVPFPAKLHARGEMAERVVRMALENVRATRLAVVAEVKKAYFGYYVTTVALRVTAENQELLERLRRVADARYRAGSVTQQDVLRAEVELYSLSNTRLTLEQEQRTAVARLNILMDRDVLAPIPEPRPFEAEKVEWELRDLLSRAVEKSPALKSLQERIERDLEAVRLATLQYVPDLSVGGAYTFISSGGVSPVATGDDAWNLNFGITLPIWLQRIRAGILERNADVLATALRYRSARNDVLFAIQDLSVRVDTEYRSAVLLRDFILPRARQVVDVSEREYQAGSLSFLTLIDNWRKLLDFDLQYHQALARLEEHFAELERVVGGQLTRRGGDELETQDVVGSETSERKASPNE